MLNKFKDWLFKEELEEMELDEELYEEEEVYPVRETRKVSAVREEMHEVEEKPVVKKEAKPQEEIKKPSTTKITIDIKADETPKRAVEKTVSRFTPRKEEYEMPPVISPYFGVKGEGGSDKTQSLNKIPHSAAKESFNSVISPFYGKTDKKHTASETLKQEVFEEPKEAFVPSFFAKETIEEEEEVNVALDEIISNKKEEEDDLIQFSLFGENKRIHEDVFENEPLEDDSDDSLPF